MEGCFPYKKHAQFYFEDIFIVVEEVMFKVPRRNLDANCESGIFSADIPAPFGSEREGSTEANPLVLQGIKLKDFCGFMKVIYHCTPEKIQLTQDEWVSVLRLSSLWFCEKVRSQAKEHLNSIVQNEPALALSLALDRSLQLEEWILPATNVLARRREPISRQEFEILGVECALKVISVRESIIDFVEAKKGFWDGKKLVNVHRADHDYTTAIRSAFQC